MNPAPRFARATAATSGTRLAVAALSFVSVLVIARALGPVGRGDVAFLLTITMVTSQLARFGVDEATINIAGSDPARRRALATNSFLLALLFGLLAIGILAPVMAVFPAVGGEVDPVLRWIALGAVPLLLVQAYLTFLIRADYGFGVTNVSWLLSPLLAAAANIALAAAGLLTVATAFLVWVGAHGVATGLLVWWIATRLEGFGRPDARLAVRTLSFGLRAHGGRAMMVGSYRVDQWFVGSIAGSHELGLYSIAVAAAEVLFYIPTVLVIVQRPYLVRASLADAARRAARVFRAGILVTAPLAAAVVAAGPLACVVLFGEDFRGAADDLRVLALGAFGVVALQQLGNALTAKGRPGLATVGATVGFAVTIALDIVLIPPYGGLGAALASTLAYTAGGLATLVLFRRVFGTRAGDLVPRPSDASALWRIGSGGLSALARGRGRLPRASTELP